MPTFCDDLERSPDAFDAKYPKGNFSVHADSCTVPDKTSGQQSVPIIASDLEPHLEEREHGLKHLALEAFVLRREMDVLRVQLKQAKEQRKSLQRRLIDRTILGTPRVCHRGTRRWTVELDRQNVRQQKDDLEAENIRLRDSARDVGTLYV